MTEEKITKSVKRRSAAELKAFHQGRIAEIDREAEARVKRDLTKIHQALQALATRSSGLPVSKEIGNASAQVGAIADRIKVVVPQ